LGPRHLRACPAPLHTPMTFRTRCITHFVGMIVFAAGPLGAQQRGQPAGQAEQTPAPPTSVDPRIFEIVAAASPERIEADITKLVSFGTRNTFSDTTSDTRGIGAARRWIKAEFDRISAACGGCLEVRYQGAMHGEGERRVNVVNVIA